MTCTCASSPPLAAALQRVVGRGVEVTALAWARDSLDGSWRAFCASLDGVLSEVAWQQGRLVAALDSGAGTIWSLAARPVEAVRAGGTGSCMALRRRAWLCLSIQ